MKFLVENYHGESKLEILTENTSAGKQLWLEGPMVMANRKNRNGREYPMESVCIPAVERYNQEYILDRRAIGEVEHPEYPFPKLAMAATMIKEPLRWDGDNAVGRAMVLNNPQGIVLKSLIEAEYNLGVSTRGLGDTVKRGGSEVVKPGYVITAVDTVDRPSGQTCYVKALVESVDWNYNEESAVWVPTTVKGARVDSIITEHATQEEFIRRFKKALNNLS